VPVHAASSTTLRQALLAVGQQSSLQHCRRGHNAQKKIPRNFTQTKLRGPLESTKLLRRTAKAKLSEAEKEGQSEKRNSRFRRMRREALENTRFGKNGQTKLNEAEKLTPRQDAGRIPLLFSFLDTTRAFVFGRMRGLRLPLPRRRPGERSFEHRGAPPRSPASHSACLNRFERDPNSDPTGGQPETACPQGRQGLPPDIECGCSRGRPVRRREGCKSLGISDVTERQRLSPILVLRMQCSRRRKP
jgi:hypothetical protein